MVEEPKGICPNCTNHEGPLGAPCEGDLCAQKGYHFIPVPWFESAKEFAARRRKPLDALLGRYISRYMLAGKLGEGGMGAVYMAIQKPLGREVALKLISGIEMTQSAVDRFEREARAIAVLDHPNIVKLHDYGIGTLEYNVPYMALEYVKHGRTLRRTLIRVRKENNGKVPGDIVLNIFRQILHALSAAHKIGLIHRDMKPDNVLITPVEGNDFQVKVLDFGLAKAVAEVSGFDKEVSRTGQILGTPIYMAPEQVTQKGMIVDAKADLHAVAVMLYEVFCGVKPYDGDSVLAILTQKTDTRHRPLEFPEAQDLPGPLKTFLDRGLAPAQEDRYQTAKDMLDALENAVAGRRITAAGPAAPDIGSSQDKPFTPLSHADEAAHLEPTTPFEMIDPVLDVQEDQPDVSSQPETSPPGRESSWLKSRWPFILGPALGIGVIAGLFFALSPAGEPGFDSLPDATNVEPATVPSNLPEPVALAPDPKPEPKPVPKSVTRMFLIETSPSSAKIKVDNRFLGPSPAKYEFTTTSEDKLQRTVKITATASGFVPATSVVELADTVQDGKVILKLKRKRVKPKNKPKRRKPKPKPKKGLELI